MLLKQMLYIYCFVIAFLSFFWFQGQIKLFSKICTCFAPSSSSIPATFSIFSSSLSQWSALLYTNTNWFLCFLYFSHFMNCWTACACWPSILPEQTTTTLSMWHTFTFTDDLITSSTCFGVNTLSQKPMVSMMLVLWTVDEPSSPTFLSLP